MNQKVHPDWINQGYEWYRAIWIECAELMDHFGYKWWKKQTPDHEQVRLEVIDIWHFGMSALFHDKAFSQYSHDNEKLQVAIADSIEAEIDTFTDQKLNVLEATEALAMHSLQSKSFSVQAFMQLMYASGLDFSALYTAYVGKNVLNFFRQDHGYKDGSYQKLWDGREDNEHLVEIVAALDSEHSDFKDNVYQALSQRYESLSVPA